METAFIFGFDYVIFLEAYNSRENILIFFFNQFDFILSLGLLPNSISTDSVHFRARGSFFNYLAHIF